MIAQKPDLSIIIVNYNNKSLLAKCLKSIYSSSNKINSEVLVIDNASSDKSSEMVRRLFPRVKLTENKTNLQYTRANNQGLRMAVGKYFLVLNEDTVIPRGSLAKMYRFMEGRPNCGLSSCREIDGNKKTIITCHKFHSPIVQIFELPLFFRFFKNSSLINDFHYTGWNRKTVRKVETIPGSFMFARRSILSKVGFFDEDLEQFFSDADLCKRINESGFDIYHNGKVAIIHYKLASAKSIPKLQIIKQSYRDMVHYYKKHYGNFWAFVIFILTRICLLGFSLKSQGCE